MATAIQSGLHNVAANWDTGVVPVAPENIVIPAGIVITQSGALDIGDSLTTAITIDEGGEFVHTAALTCRGHTALNGTLTHDRGASLLFTGGNWQITQGAVAVWRTSVGSGVLPVIDAAPGQYWTWRAGGNWDPVEVAINGIEFYRCGNDTTIGIDVRGNNDPALNFQLRNALWHSCGQFALTGSTFHGSAIVQIDTFVVINSQTNTRAVVWGANFPANWIAGSRYLLNVYVAGINPDGNVTEIRIDGQNDTANPIFETSFFMIDGKFNNRLAGYTRMSGAIMWELHTGTDSEVSSGYRGQRWVIDDLVIISQRNNAHVISAPFVTASSGANIATNVLVENTAGGGANAFPHRDSISVTNSLFLRINPFYSTAAEIAGASEYAHCTHICGVNDNQSSMLQEANESLPAYQVSGLSNIRVDTGATPNASFAAIQPSIPGAVDQYYNLDFNNHHIPNEAQPFNPYPTVVITGVAWGDARLGGNDLFVDPLFVDETRGLREYDTLMGGNGTFINLFREAFKASGWDVDGNAATLAPGRAIGDAKAWVEAGYVAQDAALKGAAHDGGDIGAFAVVPRTGDTTPPVITLVGFPHYNIQQNTTYSDQGATALDDVDGDLTASIVTVNSVDTSTVGSYTVTYNVTDAAGNAAVEVVRTVNVVAGGDTIPPVITLLGDGLINVTIDQHDVYTPPGATALDAVDGDLTASIVEVNNVDSSTIGLYTVTYTVEDAAGNIAQSTVTVRVQPNASAPIITLLGSLVESVSMGATYIDPGVTALDDVDGDITANVVVTGLPIDTSVQSFTLITYNVDDSAGNSADEAIRLVQVVVDATPPVITPLGFNNITVQQNTTYSDPGATALDDVDSDLTASIVTVNSVDTSTVGSYTVTYNVTDAAGNAAVEVVRTVNVVAGGDTIPPVITLLGVSPSTYIIGESGEYSQGATAFDDVDGDLTTSIVTVDSVDTSTVGSYTVTYNVTDAAGNAAVEVVEVINVVVRPNISLVGPSIVTILQGDPYVEFGATAYDSSANDITASIVISGVVDVTTVGLYSITYNVVDSNGTSAIEITRTVNVTVGGVVVDRSNNLVKGLTKYLTKKVIK